MARGTPPFRFPQLLEYFKNTGVRCVIRLNNKTYERKNFLNAGISHVDLFFPDGSNPPDTILQKFLEIVENQPGRDSTFF
jgi:cell division cycle 14